MILLSRAEEIILLAVYKLKGNAYGVTIREHDKKLSKNRLAKFPKAQRIFLYQHCRIRYRDGLLSPHSYLCPP